MNLIMTRSHLQILSTVDPLKLPAECAELAHIERVSFRIWEEFYVFIRSC